MTEGAGRGQAALAALTGAALIGLSPIAVRLSEVGPHATNFWRFLFALPILAVWAGLARPIPSTRQIGLILIAGVLFGIEISLWAAALGFTTVTNATLLTNLTPVFAAIFGWLLFRERLSRPVLAGGAVALTGAVVLALARAQSATGPAADASNGWIGDGLGLCAAVGYAGYLLIVRALGRQVSVGAVMFWATLSAAAVSCALSFGLSEAMLPQTLGGWAMLIGLGLVVQIAGQGLIAYGVGRLPIAISTVLLWMQPLVAAVLSWILFGEALGALALVGAALILAGVYTVQRSRA
ncbi:DMT family transporter [Terricaulis sp.]|uniref:DMT family transporter n=1 Tax=Terricaulis sp. TaxID=2768686 RepID=UPI003784BC31